MSAIFENDLLSILPKLRAMAFSFTRNRTSADDLVQDSVVRALIAQNSFVPGSNLSAWMYRLMRNHFISGLRVRRLATVSSDEPEAIAVGMSGNQETHVEQLELERELMKIPPAQRQAVLLICAFGWRYDEAATLLGCSIGTVKSRVSRGRENLRLRLGCVDEPDRPAASGMSKSSASLLKVARRGRLVPGQGGVNEFRGAIDYA